MFNKASPNVCIYSIYTYIHTYIHTYINVEILDRHTSTYVYIELDWHIYIYTYIYTYVVLIKFLCICAFVRALVCACVWVCVSSCLCIWERVSRRQERLIRLPCAMADRVAIAKKAISAVSVLLESLGEDCPESRKAGEALYRHLDSEVMVEDVLPRRGRKGGKWGAAQFRRRGYHFKKRLQDSLQEMQALKEKTRSKLAGRIATQWLVKAGLSNPAMSLRIVQCT